MFDGNPSEREEVDLYTEAAITIQSLREVALSQANALVEDYIAKRTELQMSQGDSFISLVLEVRARNENRSIQLVWGHVHYKKGKFVGRSAVKGKARGEFGYDLSSLAAEGPGWAKDLIKGCERKARLIRDALHRLHEADTALAVARARLTSLNPDSADEAEIP